MDPSYSSERSHFKQMLVEQESRRNTMFSADAGFTGNDLWKVIINQDQPAGKPAIINARGILRSRVLE